MRFDEALGDHGLDAVLFGFAALEREDTRAEQDVSWLLALPTSESFRNSPSTRLEVPLTLDEIHHVLSALADRLKAAIGGRVESARRALTETLRPKGVATGFASDLFRTRDELLAENAALRQQFIVASRKVKKPAFRPLERAVLVALASRVSTWRDAVLSSHHRR